MTEMPEEIIAEGVALMKSQMIRPFILYFYYFICHEFGNAFMTFKNNHILSVKTHAAKEVF